MPLPSGKDSQVEVVIRVRRRRRCTPEQKLESVKRSMEPAILVSLMAREADMTASQLFQWRNAYTEGSLVAVNANQWIHLCVARSDFLTLLKCPNDLTVRCTARSRKKTLRCWNTFGTSFTTLAHMATVGPGSILRHQRPTPNYKRLPTKESI